jgi:hypothetical protein
MQKITSDLEKFEQSAPCNFAILQACKLQATNMCKIRPKPILFNGLLRSEMLFAKNPNIRLTFLPEIRPRIPPESRPRSCKYPCQNWSCKMFNGLLESEMPLPNNLS